MTMSKFKLRHIDAIGLRAPDAEGECRIKNMIYVCVIYCPTQRYTITQQLGKKKRPVIGAMFQKNILGEMNITSLLLESLSEHHLQIHGVSAFAKHVITS